MANVEGFEVAGKTGTAQKADPVHGGYAAKKRVGSFVGFVPANDPRLVALVLIDEPEGKRLWRCRRRSGLPQHRARGVASSRGGSGKAAAPIPTEHGSSGVADGAGR